MYSTRNKKSLLSSGVFVRKHKMWDVEKRNDSVPVSIISRMHQRGMLMKVICLFAKNCNIARTRYRTKTPAALYSCKSICTGVAGCTTLQRRDLYSVISAVQLSAPILPSGSRLFRVWKSLTAFSVAGPKSPSGVSRPRRFLRPPQ